MITTFGIGRMCHIAFWEPQFAGEFKSVDEWKSQMYRIGAMLHPLTIEQNALTSFKSRTTLVPCRANTIGPGIFLQADDHYFDDETRALLDEGINPLMSPGVQLSVTSEESKAINLNRQSKVIISASGMCEAGRIRHHLKHNLWRRECLILFVGYQAMGTTGRAIRDGAKKIKLFGEEIKVNAEISYLPGKSGHADKEGLIKWIQAFKEKPHTVFVNHGDPDAVDDYAACLREEYGFNTVAPYSGTSFDLLAGEIIELTEGVPVAKKAPRDARAVSAFDNLLTAAYGLIDVIKACKGIPNKELAKFAGEIRSLASKWEGWANRR